MNGATASEAAILETHISRCRCHGAWTWDAQCPITGETDPTAVIIGYAREQALRRETE
jgi:hypothetical protein